MYRIRRVCRGAAAVCTAGLLLAGCGYSPESSAIPESSAGPENTASIEITEISTEITEQDKTEAINQKLKDITPNNHTNPVDMDRYDSQTDQIYKAAFLKAITNQKPIRDKTREKSIYYKDLLQETDGMDEEELLRYSKQSDFFYQDFDGDGLPELTVDTEGPCVLKYNAEEDMVELYYRKGQGWHLLGTGQMFYYDLGAVNESESGQIWEYAFETVKDGHVEHSFVLYKGIFPERSTGWQHIYTVSVDEYKEIEVEEEQYNELNGAYFDAKYGAPHPMTFSAMFGDDESGGYFPGSQPKLRYLLEDQEYLPMNEKTGEEWEAYKTMLRGDFSLVESEDWGSLQSKYESNLESGNGTCNWSYFLMDFNQDGRNELCIRYYPEGVNNTAFFRYEDGHVKMWGSYHSGDSHGYNIPLRNGKIMSVSWYRDYQDQWINRLGSKGYHEKEREYIRTADYGDEEDIYFGDGETELSYSFQDYYRDGNICGTPTALSEEEWTQIQDMIENLMIPETEWQSCSEFTPMSDRPEIPLEG